MRSSVDGNQSDGVFVNSGGNQFRFVAVDSTFNDNGGSGISIDYRAKHVKLKRVAFAGNRLSGVRPWLVRPASACDTQIKLDDATFSSNDGDPACGSTEACVAVDACRAPRVKPPLVCSTSHVVGSGVPGDTWGVYSLD